MCHWYTNCYKDMDNIWMDSTTKLFATTNYDYVQIDTFSVYTTCNQSMAYMTRKCKNDLDYCLCLNAS